MIGWLIAGFIAGLLMGVLITLAVITYNIRKIIERIHVIQNRRPPLSKGAVFMTKKAWNEMSRQNPEMRSIVNKINAEPNITGAYAYEDKNCYRYMPVTEDVDDDVKDDEYYHLKNDTLYYTKI